MHTPLDLGLWLRVLTHHEVIDATRALVWQLTQIAILVLFATLRVARQWFPKWGARWWAYSTSWTLLSLSAALFIAGRIAAALHH